MSSMEGSGGGAGYHFKMPPNTHEAKGTLTKFPEFPKYYDPSYWKTLHLNTRSVTFNTRLRLLDEEPIGEGKECEAYLFRDENLRREVIIKVPKKTLNEETKGNEGKSEADSRWKNQVLAYQLASLYRRSVLTNKHAIPLYYLPPFYYEFTHPFKGYKYLYGEPYIKVDTSEWRKLSNNYIDCVSESVGAFSHFTWAIT